MEMFTRIGIAALMIVAVACGGVDSNYGTAAQNVGTAAVSTDKAVYQPGYPITLSWSGLPGNQLDWVAVAYANSPVDSGVRQWTYVNGQTSGSHVFDPQQPGAYEARAYSDNSFGIIATSTFTVSGATVSTDKAIYSPGDTVQVTWAGMPGNQQDWVAVANAGAAPGQVAQWTYINGAASGTHGFTGLALGSYEAQMYFDNTNTQLATSNFTIAAANVSIASDQTTYGVNAPIKLSWTGMPGNQKDWIGITPANSPPDTNIVAWTYINGVTDGSYTFPGLNAGDYIGRAYLNNDTSVLATTGQFTVSSATVTPTISTNASNYLTNAPITVSWSGLPGNNTDWIAIAAAGSADSSVLEWQYTNGATSGSIQFNGFSANGGYEARAYVNNTNTVIARSPFTVSQLCVSAGQQRPNLSSLTSGDLTIGLAATEASAALSNSLSTSVLFFTTSENEPSPAYGAVMCELRAADTTRPAGITCFRNNAGTDSGSGTITVHWTVATFSSGVTVQRGEAQTYASNPTDAALTTIDPSKSFVLLGGMMNGGSGWGNNEFVRAQILDANTLELRTNVTGTSVAWQVVQMDGSSVQRGSTTFASAATQQSVTVSTIPSGSMLMTSYTTDNPSGIAAATLMLQGSLTDSTSFMLQRAQGGSNLDISWEVVSLPYATHSGIVDFTAGQSSQSQTVSGIAASSSVAVGTSQSILGQSTGSTTYAGSSLDLPGEASAAMTTGAGSVSFMRGTSQASAEIPFTVIDFAHDCTGN